VAPGSQGLAPGPVQVHTSSLHSLLSFFVLNMGRSGTMLPVALAALSGWVLPRCSALQKVGADAIAMFEKAETAGSQKWAVTPAYTKWLSWWTEGSRSEWLTLYDIELGKDATAIVTHAGKNNQEYIDHAVMLGVSLKRHMPDYPRIALGVRGMSDEHQQVLEDAGWHVVLVADWSFSDDENTHGCQSAKSCTDDKFILQQKDSMERLNVFRLPIGRVLYLDADTYVASGELNSLLNGTGTNLAPEGNIGMVPHACNRVRSAGHGATAPYSAGVMLLKPSLEKYKGMLVKVAEIMARNATSRKNDEEILNEVYGSQVTALDRKYNCIDRTGKTAAAECAQNCKEVVVTHFTGLPKPASADAKFLDIVRRPYSPILHCFNTNHGSCRAWSAYYCDVVQNKQSLTKRLRQTLEATGSCCHTPRQESDPPECRDGCPSQVKLDPSPGVFNKTNLFSHPVWNAGRPIYIGPSRTSGANLSRGPSYMYYLKPYGNWVLGWDPNSTMAWAYSHERASCPSDIKRWKEATTRRYVDTKSTAVADSPFTGDMVLDLQSGSGEWIK